MSYWVARRSSSTGARSSWVRCRASSRSAAICCFRSMVLAEAPQTNPARLATAPKSPAVDHRYVLLCDSLVLRLCRDYHYGRGCWAAATYRMPTVHLTRTHVRRSGPGMGWRRERPRRRFSVQSLCLRSSAIGYDISHNIASSEGGNTKWKRDLWDGAAHGLAASHRSPDHEGRAARGERGPLEGVSAVVFAAPGARRVRERVVETYGSRSWPCSPSSRC